MAEREAGQRGGELAPRVYLGERTFKKKGGRRKTALMGEPGGRDSSAPTISEGKSRPGVVRVHILWGE